MPTFLKELIVILAIAVPLFAYAKPIALQFTDARDFNRRRNVWMILTATAFFSPSFWPFVVVAVPLLYWGGKKDSNPLAFFFLLMNVIPSIRLDIPIGGLGIELFELDIFRLVALCVLVPAAWQVRKSADPDHVRKLQLMDYLLLGYGALIAIWYVSPDLPSHVILHNSPTNVVRDALLYYIDMYVIYYVASRSCTSREKMRDALATFCLSCALMAAVAAFESLKHWLLYTDLYFRWGGKVMDEAYLIRAGLLRAEASSGNALALGYLLAVSLGFWAYLASRLQRPGLRTAVAGLFWIGLLASMSRGPWLGAILIYMAYSGFRPGGAGRMFKSALVVLLIGCVMIASPIGHRFTDSLPYIGKSGAAAGSIDYRERLLERSWQLIKASPWLGDQLALSKMNDLRQGEGIIDVVNTYLNVTLFHGFIGLALFLGFALLALSKARRASKRARASDPDMVLLGATVAACMVGTLFMLADSSFQLGYVPGFFALGGFAVNCFRLTQAAQSQTAIAASAATSPGSL